MPATAAPDRPRRLRPLRKAAEAYGINQRTIRRWIAAGLISSYRVGDKLIAVDLNEIDQRAVRLISLARDDAQEGVR
jgi:excisionase family DNA binding protein